MRKYFLVFFITTLSFAQTNLVTSESMQDERVFLFFWKYNFGDSASWVNKDYDDSHWSNADINKIPSKRNEIQYLRAKVKIDESVKDKPLIIRVHYHGAAYQVYWDGKLVEENGVVSTDPEKEIPGKVGSAVILDSGNFSAGDHTLVLRSSASNFFRDYFPLRAKIDANPHPNIYDPDYFVRLILYVGICLTAGVFGAALFWGGGRFTANIYYSLMCFSALFHKGFIFIVFYFSLSTTFLQYQSAINIVSFYLIQIFIFAFFVVNFNLKHKLLHTGVVVLASLIEFGGRQFDIDLYDYYSIFLLLYGIRILLEVVKSKKQGGFIALAGYILYFIPELISVWGVFVPVIYYDLSLYAFIFIMIITIGKQAYEQKILQKEIELKAKRLEAELLRKSIQPHFIINTLSTIRSLTKRQPESADKLINALASEFRLMNKISSEKEIPISQEIELCEEHLEVMGLRWDALYTLHKKDISESCKIPPLIFLTLIENGLTHAFNPKENGNFWLSCREAENKKEFVLSNDGSLLMNTNPVNNENIIEGTGIKYVKNRLEECYPGHWTMDYGIRDSKWEVRININGAKK